MQLVTYFEINAIAMAVLAIIVFSMRHVSPRHFYHQRLFLGMVGFIAATLIFDSLMWAFDKRIGSGMIAANTFSTVAYYICSLFPSMLWAFYCSYLVYRNKKRMEKQSIFFFTLLIINIILALLSLTSKNYFFYIDTQNVYHRGPLFHFFSASIYLFFIYSYFIAIKNRRSVDRRTFLVLILFPSIPILAGIFQMIYFGLAIIWPSAALSLLIIFVSTQNLEIQKDHLTNLYNRRQFDLYLAEKILKARTHPFAGIMMDMDNLKTINDVYGHVVGDAAIEQTALLLHECTPKDSFLARFAGDEFVVLADIENENDLKIFIDNIRRAFMKFNESNYNPYSLSVSVGGCIYDPTKHESTQAFVHAIDQAMYLEKSKLVR